MLKFDFCVLQYIMYTYTLSQIAEAYDLFENKRDGVIKVAVEC